MPTNKQKPVSMSVIRRLPRYCRFLSELEKSGVTRISSRTLSEKMGLTASQIRQDLNCFGGFGQQGYGYNVPQLSEAIREILGLQRHYPCILIGAGNLGRAIAGHIHFGQLGFRLIGVFDNAPQVIGQRLGPHQVLPYSQIAPFYQAHRPAMAILCVPRDSVEAISDELYGLGLRCFWNFGHYDIPLKHPGVVVENVHLNDSLMTLCYKLSAAEGGQDGAP